MQKSVWVRILEYLYENEGSISVSVEVDQSIDNRINEVRQQGAADQFITTAANLETGTGETAHILSHMEQWGLIGRDSGPSRAAIFLDEKGFEVIHDRLLSEQQIRTNRALMYLTGALALTALVEFSFLLAPKSTPNIIAAGLVGLLVSILIGMALGQILGPYISKIL